MSAIEYSIFDQLILTIILQLFITFPCIFAIFKYYLDKQYSTILQTFFYLSLIYAVTTIIKSDYLIIFWKPSGAIYD